MCAAVDLPHPQFEEGRTSLDARPRMTRFRTIYNYKLAARRFSRRFPRTLRPSESYVDVRLGNLPTGASSAKTVLSTRHGMLSPKYPRDSTLGRSKFQTAVQLRLGS